MFAVCCYIGHLVLCTAAATSPSVGRHDDAAESDAPLSARPAANVRLAPVSPRTPRTQPSSVLDHELEVLERERALAARETRLEAREGQIADDRQRVEAMQQSLQEEGKELREKMEHESKALREREKAIHEQMQHESKALREDPT